MKVITSFIAVLLVVRVAHADTNTAPVVIGTPLPVPIATTSTPETWTTTDGKTYVGVKVVKVEDDSVTIFYRDGGARIDLVKLPPDLQKRFNYDPAKAEAASVQRKAREDAVTQYNRDALAATAYNKQFEDFINAHAFVVKIQVFQINPGGALADMSILTEEDVRTVVPDKSWGGIFHDTTVEHTTVVKEFEIPQKVWVIGLPDSLVDGDAWTGIVYLVGRHTYQTIEGADSTVRMFAASRDAAIQSLKSQSQ